MSLPSDSKSQEQKDVEAEIYGLIWAVHKGEKHPHGVFLRIVELLDQERAK